MVSCSVLKGGKWSTINLFSIPVITLNKLNFLFLYINFLKKKSQLLSGHITKYRINMKSLNFNSLERQSMTYLSYPTYLIPRMLLWSSCSMSLLDTSLYYSQSGWASFQPHESRENSSKYLLVSTQVYLLTRATSVLIYVKFTNPGNQP